MMAASIIMNQMIVGGTSGGSIRLMYAAELPAAITPRTICAITEEPVSEMLMQADAPEHVAGLIWIQIENTEPEIIGADGEEAVELIRAWISLGEDWAPVEAYHSATGEWVQFSGALMPVPEFAYTGTSSVIDDGNGNWRIKFLTSGILTLAGNRIVDAFLVGGGGAGHPSSGAGGNGGRTLTEKRIALLKNESITIAIGAGGATTGGAGGATSFGDILISGGASSAGGSGGAYGGSGGGAFGNPNGGNGGSNGVNGADAGGYLGGTGQGTTTREFDESTGALYAGGGGGGGYSGTGGTGGSGGGGRGNGTGGARTAGTANTGGGGGGNSNSNSSGNGAGGSGIVIIRNAR